MKIPACVQTIAFSRTFHIAPTTGKTSGIGTFLNAQKCHLPNNGRRLSKESLASLPDDIIFVLKLITLRHAKYN